MKGTLIAPIVIKRVSSSQVLLVKCFINWSSTRRKDNSNSAVTSGYCCLGWIYKLLNHFFFNFLINPWNWKSVSSSSAWCRRHCFRVWTAAVRLPFSWVHNLLDSVHNWSKKSIFEQSEDFKLLFKEFDMNFEWSVYLLSFYTQSPVFSRELTVISYPYYCWNRVK